MRMQMTQQLMKRCCQAMMMQQLAQQRTQPVTMHACQTWGPQQSSVACLAGSCRAMTQAMQAAIQLPHHQLQQTTAPALTLAQVKRLLGMQAMRAEAALTTAAAPPLQMTMVSSPALLTAVLRVVMVGQVTVTAIPQAAGEPFSMTELCCSPRQLLALFR
jgi:hypothetical protein